VRWLRALRFGWKTRRFYVTGAVNRLTGGGVLGRLARSWWAFQTNLRILKMTKLLAALSIAAFAATGAFAQAKKEEKAAAPAAAASKADKKEDKKAAAPAAAASAKK
jgi:hypothetical protein